MTGNDDKRHLHTKRQQVPETVTPHFTMLIGVCGVNQSAITNVSNVSNMAKISGSGSHRLTKRVIKRDMRPIINHPVAYSDRQLLQTELLFWHARWLNHTRRQFR